MKYRILGRTGLKVSEVGLGGEWFNGLSEEESIRIVDAAEQNGVKNFSLLPLSAAPR